jgi:very-short-patch-repair endonuclease
MAIYIDNAVLTTLFHQRKFPKEIAKTLGCSGTTIRRRLRVLGLLRTNSEWTKLRMARMTKAERRASMEHAMSFAKNARRLDVTPQMVEKLHFDDLLSIKAIAQQLSVSRNVVTRRLLDAGYWPRNARYAQLIRNAKLTASQRKENARAANASRRGSTSSIEHLIKSSQSRQGKPLSINEQIIFENLRIKGHTGIPQFSAHIYNIDLAFPDKKIAIEIDGGNWHTGAKHSLEDAKKASYLLRNGWLLLRVGMRLGKILTPDFIHKVCTLLQI